MFMIMNKEQHKKKKKTKKYRKQEAMVRDKKFSKRRTIEEIPTPRLI